MSSEVPGWQRTTWGEVATLEYGKGLKGYRALDRGVPVFGTNGPIGFTNRSPLCNRPGVVVGRKGAYRGVHFSKSPFYVIDTAFWLNPDPEVDPRWAYYELLTRDINSMDSGSAIPSTSRSDFYALPLHLPPMSEQRAIGRMLGSLDDKIELNTQMTATLQELVLLHISTVANASHDESRAPVSAIARYVNGKAFTKHADGAGRMIIRIAELNSGPGGSTKYTTFQTEGDYLAHPGDLLFAWSGSLDVYRWYRDEALINQHIFKVIPKNGIPDWFVFWALKEVMPRFRAIASDKATTMGHIKRSNLDEAEVPVLTNERMSDLDSVVAPLWEMSLELERESLILRDVRDAVLPQLMSGRLRIPEELENVEEAV